jgi:hypothetical protein
MKTMKIGPLKNFPVYDTLSTNLLLIHEVELRLHHSMMEMFSGRLRLASHLLPLDKDGPHHLFRADIFMDGQGRGAGRAEDHH